MWITKNYKGKVQVWYSEELIKQIKKECQEAYDNNDKFYNLSQRILGLIECEEG